MDYFKNRIEKRLKQEYKNCGGLNESKNSVGANILLHDKNLFSALCKPVSCSENDNWRLYTDMWTDNKTDKTENCIYQKVNKL